MFYNQNWTIKNEFGEKIRKFNLICYLKYKYTYINY